VSKRIPLFPLELVLFPGTTLPLHIFEDRYKEMIGECLREHRPFGIIQSQKKGIAAIGCSAEVVSVINRYEDGKLDILTEGQSRFRVIDTDTSRAFIQGDVEFFDDDPGLASNEDRTHALASHFELVHLYGSEDDIFPNIPPDSRISFLLAAMLPVDLQFKQAVLELRSEPDRVRLLNEYYDAVLPKMRHIEAAKKTAPGNGHVM